MFVFFLLIFYLIAFILRFFFYYVTISHAYVSRGIARAHPVVSVRHILTAVNFDTREYSKGELCFAQQSLLLDDFNCVCVYYLQVQYHFKF